MSSKSKEIIKQVTSSNKDLDWIKLLKVEGKDLDSKDIDTLTEWATKGHQSIPSIIDVCKDSDQFAKRHLDRLIDKIPYGSFDIAYTFDMLKDCKLLASINIIRLARKAHPSTLTKVVEHIPYTKMGNSLGMRYLLKNMANKCPEDKKVEFVRNARRSFIRAFNLHILEVGDTLETLPQSVPSLAARRRRDCIKKAYSYK